MKDSRKAGKGGKNNGRQCSCCRTCSKDQKKKESQFSLVMKRLRKNKLAMAGLVIILILFVVALLAPWIMPYAYDEMNMLERFSGPSFAHLCGTDEMEEIFSPSSLWSKSFPFPWISGNDHFYCDWYVYWFHCWIFRWNCRYRCNETCGYPSGNPRILLAVAISACLGSGFVNTIIALSIGGIPMTVRLLRGSIMGVRKMEYLEAAQTINCSVPRLIMKHILPNSISPIIVSVTMGIGNTILMAASLSYIGLGVQPHRNGALCFQQQELIVRDYLIWYCFRTCHCTCGSFADMLGDGLRDALDPKLKK